MKGGIYEYRKLSIALHMGFATLALEAYAGCCADIAAG